MLKQLQIINYPQLLTLAKQSDLLVNLIFAANTNDLIQPLATQCLGYLLDNLNPESIQQALSVLILQQIYQGSVIKLILKNLTDTQILQLFSQTNLFNQSGLMADHDLNFLQYLANRLGSSNFKQLLHVTDHRGQAHSVLFYYAKKFTEF
jgi:hypothetical protein